MAFPKATAALADRVAAKYLHETRGRGERPTYEAVRDFCDLFTGSEMCCSQLNRLADWVGRRVGVTP